MSTVIKGGTVVTADRTYEADVLIEGETIAAVGPNLSGDTVVDAEGAYVMPGGIDPHTHLQMPFMGTTAAETFESGTFAALSGGTTMVVDFVIPSRTDGGLLDALEEWEGRAKPQVCADYSYHMCVTGWSETIFDEMAEVVKRGVNTFKHFMAYKGATTTRCSRRSSAAPPSVRSPSSTRRTATSSPRFSRSTWRRGSPARRGMPIPGRRRSRARPPTARS
jgi:dihydropyrimidinase